MYVSFLKMLCVMGLIILGLLFSANTGVIPSILEAKQYNVMLLEADLKTPKECDKTKWASNQAAEISAYGFWFCKGRILGRLVDEYFFANLQEADLVHYVMKSEARCRENGLDPPEHQELYIYLDHSKDGKVKIIEEDDERAIQSEFVQTAISVLEMEAYSTCTSKSPALNLTRWGWETLNGVDF